MIAADVYEVEGRDRDLSSAQRGLRWLGTMVSGLLDAQSSAAPAMSDVVVIRRADGAELRRWHPSTMEDFERIVTELGEALDGMQADEFAAEWLTES